MTPELVTSIFLSAIKTAVLLASPMLISGLVVGILVSMFQTATQINEMTLTFIPKLVVVGLVLMLGGHWMISLLMNFSLDLINSIPELIH